MLILSRRPCQAIKVGHDIEIRVFRCANGHVRFGITAPRCVLILREELLNRPAPQLPSRSSPPRQSSALRRTPRR
ncbi:carbon storage regulator [Lysobacter sp. CA199]|uniref:carbon storage regulator n=1 Tax=Lysobacter sp. CA199 TaxID=3455608 RepID=UPI003F8D5D96